MAGQEKFIEDTLTVANSIELVKATIAKVGLEFIAPLSSEIQDEKISKAITAKVKGAAQ